MDYKLKINSTLSFNLEAERDIVANIHKLKSQHRLGEFISNCVRVALDNPELLEKNKTSLESFKLTDNRKKFIEATKIEIERLAYKINETYKLAYEMHSLAKFNKKFDLSSSSKNILASQFILSKQVEDLKKLLGVVSLEQTVNLHKVDISSSDILEYIVLAHQDVVNELKENASKADKYDKKLEELNSLLDKHSKELDGIEKKKEFNNAKPDVSVKAEIDDKDIENNTVDTKADELDGFTMSESADLAGLADLIRLT